MGIPGLMSLRLTVWLPSGSNLTMAISTFGYNLHRRGITRAIFLDQQDLSVLQVPQAQQARKVLKAAVDLDSQQTGG